MSSHQARRPRAWIATLATLAMTALAPATHADPRDFDIPRQSAERALTEFARQAGMPVLFPYDLVEGRTTNALRGRLEPADALRQLLRGTGLEAGASVDGQITVRVRPPPRPPAGLVAALKEVERVPPEEAIGEITITGTRIERNSFSTPTPVTAIFSSELQAMGPGMLVDALVQLPQFLNNDTPQTQSFVTSGAAGASFMNLRGIGSSRTLTLLDGRRIVPTTRSGAVDIALLPKTLIERVDVVTGGASAAYGSDAVSGVVNLVLEQRTQGVKLRAQGGISERGDNANHEVSGSWGFDIGDSSHLVLAGEVFRADGIRGYASREWFDGWAAIENPDPRGPREVVVRDAHATGYTYGGLITRGPLAGLQFLEGGRVAPFEPGLHATATAQSGGSGIDPARDLVWILPDQQRGTGFARLETRFGDGAKAFLQGLFGYSNNHFVKDPASQWGAWEATIYADNAFLPVALRDRMRAEGIDSFPLGRMGGSKDLRGGEVDNRSRLSSGTLGVELPVPALPGWRLDGYYQYGENHADLRYEDTVRVDRIYRAFDSVVDPSTGRAVCRSTLSFPDDGCVPANPFGPGSISPEARDWLTEGATEQQQRITQHVAEATLQGTAGRLPAGAPSFALGAAWRRESVDNHPRRYPADLEGLTVEPDGSQGYRGLPAAYLNQTNIFERTLSGNVVGAYSVWEAFGESVLPMVRNRPALRRFDLTLAARYANYGGSGGVMAWKTGIDWQVTDALRLRATRSRDIRAGSLSERFDFSGGGTVVDDPFRPELPNYGVIAIRGGDPQVRPEEADTLTFGAVWQSPQVPGLWMAADYYDIRIDDAIASLGAQAIADRCFEGDTVFCARIVRNPDTGLITSIDNRFQNIAEARSRGIDAELGLRRRVTLLGGDEGLALRVFVNHALESSTTAPGQPTVDRAGQTGLIGGAPRWQANFTLAYERGPLQVTVQERLVSSGRYNAAWGPADIDDNRVGGAAYTNLRVSWRWGTDPTSTLLFLNVTNLFDRDPPLAPDWGFIGSVHTNEGLFDVLGRRYTLGLRLRF